MSDMEHSKGKLIPFNLTEDVARELVMTKFGEYYMGLPDYYHSHFDMVDDDPEYFKLAKINGKFYKVEWEIREGELYGFADVKANEDGTIDFDTWHYNGGAHWTEVVECALNE